MSACKWNGSSNPRVLPRRHLDGCDTETCEGCEPCTEAHCRICSRAHADGTCPDCLDDVRTSLAELLRMCADLPAEVVVKGVDSEAFTLLGPAADPEAWGHREASAKAGRIDAGYLDTADDARHPLFVLATWEDVYREALDHETDARATVTGAAAYIDQQMTYIAGFEHVPFEDMARELRQCVTWMERVLHDGEQIEKGAPCPECGRHLTLVHGKTADDDRWVCDNRRCEVIDYTLTAYRGWVEDDARENASELNAEDMALRFDLKASAVRVWGARDLVRKRGKDSNGMTLYVVADVVSRLAEKQSA